MAKLVLKGGGRNVSAGYSPFTLETHMRDMNGIIREKISAPPMTMTSGSISSRRSSSSTEWITCTPSAVQAGHG